MREKSRVLEKGGKEPKFGVDLVLLLTYRNTFPPSIAVPLKGIITSSTTRLGLPFLANLPIRKGIAGAQFRCYSRTWVRHFWLSVPFGA